MVYVAGNGHTAIVEVLLARGITVNAPYENGLTALMWASGFGHLSTVTRLLERGADKALPIIAARQLPRSLKKTVFLKLPHCCGLPNDQVNFFAH